jgi:TfoX/Sxy family transcriptional regulator of competence genes
MGYDEGLAERLRGVFEDQRGVVEKRMFGGLCFMVDGKMCVGIVGDELMVRVGPEQHSQALAQPHARPMDFTGRPMKGFVYVAADGLETDKALEGWVAQGVSFARSVAGRVPRRAPGRAISAKPRRRRT